MLVYILKSVACLSILFVFYKVFLEKENMHVFKRFYLLGALIFSLIIPSLVFIEYVETAPIIVGSAPVLIQETTNADDIINVSPTLKADLLDIEPLLWGVYFLGLFFFGLKFIRNLFQIFKRIRSNPKQRLSRFTQVLLQEKITPHTFFSYIFLNKKKFETNQIPAEVLLHEETHAQQKHSWDVVLVELLQVFFWVNPFIYLTKKAIKLNHEFLADQAVLKKNINKTTYQNTLLSYLSPDSAKKYQPLANAINYSSIKKRFKIMKTHTSKKAILLRSLLLLPLLAMLIYGFSETKIETISSDPVNNEPIIQKDVVQKTLKKASEKEFILNINDSKITLNGKQIDLDTFAKEVDLITESWEETDYTSIATLVNFSATPKVFLEKIEREFKKTNFSKANEGSSIFSTDHSKQTTQNSASPKQVEEYNTLAKKYNTMLSKSMSIQIKMKDVERLEFIYNQMADKQKADAEPFPDFPPMPESPAPPKAPRIMKGEKSDISQPPSPQEIEKVIEEVIEIEEVSEIEEAVEIEEIIEVEPPMPPKPPKSPLDHVIEMAKKDAIFKYKGKKISSDMAIDLLKNNTNLSISTKIRNNDPPIVKISKHL